MRIIHVVYSGAKCRATSNAVSGQIRTLRAEFSFSEDWDAYPERMAVFISGTHKELKSLDENNSCEVSESVSKAGYLQVGAFAIAKDSSGEIMRYPGEYARVCLGQGASPDGSAEPSEEEASVYEEMLMEMREAAKAANEAAAFARENGETAWNQAAYANEEATNAYSAAEGAKDATWRAREAGQRASEAATLASMNSDFAREAGRYAYGIIGNLYRDAVLPFTEAEISETGEFSGFETNPDFYNTGKTYFRYKTDNGVSFKWTNPRPQEGSLKITMCAYGQYEEHFTSSMNVHYTDGTQDSFEFTHGVTVVYDTDKTKTVESMTGGPYVSDYGYQPWILLDMDVMSIIASYLIPQSDWLAEEGEAGHILNRTHYQAVSNSPGYMPYDECDVEALGVGTHLVFKPTNETHFKNTFVYESMRSADPFTYNIDYSCFYPPTGGEISFKYRAEQMVVNTLFTLIDTKNYRIVQFSSGVTAYVILDVGTLAEEYKSKFPEIGIYLDVEESVYTNRRITIQVVRVYRLNELYIPDTIARITDIPEGGTGGASIIIREW